MTGCVTPVCPDGFRDSITFFDPRDDTTDDGYGGIVGGAGADLLTILASIVPENIDEKNSNEQTKTERRFTIETWFSDVLSALGQLTKLQVRFGTRIFRVDSDVNEDEKNMLIRIRATELLTDG